MEPTVKLALLCDYAFRTQDNKLSIIGVFSQISLADLPAASPPFFVVISLALDRGTHQVQFGLVDPMGQQVVPDAPAFDVEVETAGADTDLLLQFNGTLEEVESHQGRLSALPGEGDFENVMGGDVLSGVLFEQGVRHAETAPRKQPLFREEEAVLAIEVADCAAGLQQNVKSSWRRSGLRYSHSN